eukprot:TRINITY_DN65258_c0_g1_i1.p1 TRINITY_DN65258_c0_g1~~TRINITY_DN65258_c0_g1_i1.p1  ORF type:complete len:607 (-),score=68.00 TRINITY_DN65258_c0_g1_i1:91-1911(-)
MSNSQIVEFLPERKSPLVQEMTIYFGSQTGTAASFAKMLFEEASNYTVSAKIVDLALFDPVVLESEKLAIFIVATYCKGLSTDNAKVFYHWLTDEASIKPNSLKSLNFSVFGCGNSGFKAFNRVAKTTTAKILERGAKLVYEPGYGDANGCLEDDFTMWKAGLWAALGVQQKVCSIPKSDNFQEFVITCPSHCGLSQEDLELDVAAKQYNAASTIYITNIRQLRQSTEETATYSIELNIRDSGLSYHTGDLLAIYPENDPEVAEKLAKLQGWTLGEKFVLKRKEGSNTPAPFQGPITIQDVLTRIYDLSGLVQKSVLKKLAAVCQNPENIEYYIEHYDKFKEKHLSIVDLIVENKIKLPFIDFAFMCGKIAPRYYSISSSHKMHPEMIRLTAVLTNKLVDGNIKKGLCSSYFERIFDLAFNPSKKIMNSPIKVRAFVKDSVFGMQDFTAPVIMVGPGSGIAPFIGYIEEREYCMRMVPGTDLPPLILFFGCRNKAKDFIYKKELERWEAMGALTQLHVSFSRDQERKTYVQDLIKAEKENLYNLITIQEATIHVCGSGIMGEGVKKALIEVLRVGKANPEAYLEELERKGRYVIELWGQFTKVIQQ